MAFVLKPLSAEWSSSHKQLSLLQTCMFGGELVGGLVWGGLSDRFGRRLTFIGTAALATVFGLASSVAPSLSWFLAARFGLGLAIGGSLSIDFVYFIEFVPAKSRGFRTTFVIFLGICALLYTALIGWFVLPFGWRWFIVACGMPNAFLLVARLGWRWESPRFLLGQGRLKEATAVLTEMAVKNGKSLPPGQLITTCSNCKSQQSSSTWFSPFADVWRAGLMRPVLTMGLMFFAQTFAYYGLTNWLQKLLIEKGIPALHPSILFAVMGIAEIPGLLLTTLLIETRGRKLVFVINFVGSAIATLSMILVQGQVSFLIASACTYFFIVGSWTALYVTTPELFPTSVRSTAFTISHCMGKVAGALSPLIFGLFWDVGMRPVWILLTVAGSFLLAAVTASFLLIETAGSRLQDNI